MKYIIKDSNEVQTQSEINTITLSINILSQMTRELVLLVSLVGVL